MTLNNNIYGIGIDPHDAYAMHLRHLSIYIFSESGRYPYSNKRQQIFTSIYLYNVAL